VASVNRISIEPLENLLVNQYHHDFPEREYEGKLQMSVEESKFRQLVSSAATLKDNHYYLPLPLRNSDVIMPNNHHIAEQRVHYLAMKFQKDAAYAEEYKVVMEDGITKGYAEKVPSKDLHQNDGKVWYKPHHRVYHKRKKDTKSSI